MSLICHVQILLLFAIYIVYIQLKLYSASGEEGKENGGALVVVI